MSSKLGNITFYADDPHRLAAFWAAVFHYPSPAWDEPLRSELLASGLSESDLASRASADPPDGAPGPRLFFHHAGERKAGRNRLHLDVRATPGHKPSREELEAEKERLVALGAEVVRLIDQTWGEWPELSYQMRDPEGNEFCLE